MPGGEVGTDRQGREGRWGYGCGSVEVSLLRCEDLPVAVFRVVDAFVFAAEVK
jgi:hypothetical protein